MATFAPDHEPEMIDKEPPEEFREPEREPQMGPEKQPEIGLDGGDQGMEGSADLEAEVLFQVAHYSKEYKAPASLADIAFEIQEKDSDVHEAMMMAVEEGTPKVTPILKSLVEQGLIMETEFGGYITTPDGDEMVGTSEVQSGLGNTYESEKHKGNPADEGPSEDDFGEGSEGGESEKEPEKVEGGVPFL